MGLEAGGGVAGVLDGGDGEVDEASRRADDPLPAVEGRVAERVDLTVEVPAGRAIRRGGGRAEVVAPAVGRARHPAREPALLRSRIEHQVAGIDGEVIEDAAGSAAGPRDLRDAAEVAEVADDAGEILELRQPAEELVLHLFVLSDLLHVRSAYDDVRHLEDAEFGVDGAHDCRGSHQLGGPDLDASHHLLVAAELARMEDFDIYLALERAIGTLGIFIGGDGEQRAGKPDMAEAQRDRLRKQRSRRVCH